jgi:hypothetical protein
VVVEQPDVDQLDLLPGLVVDLLGMEFAMQLVDHLGDAVVVELDAVLDQLVDAVPVGLLEQRLGVTGTGSEHHDGFVGRVVQRSNGVPLYHWNGSTEGVLTRPAW